MGKLEDETPKKPIRLSSSVGEGGDNLTADVIGVEMHLNIFIVAGALKGVSDALFTIGQMTPRFIEVIKIFQKQIVGLSRPDGKVDVNGRTIKFLNGPISARGGKVTPGPVTPPANVMAARKKIADVAGKYLNEGGHFLMGSQGDMPGMANGHPLRPAITMPATFMDESHPKKLGPAVKAAWIPNTAFGALGCMGRPFRKGIPNNGIIAPSDPRLAQLTKYMESIRKMRDAGIPVTRWPGFDAYLGFAGGFDAATTFGQFDTLCTAAGVGTQFPRRINPDGAIHLGESCVGHRHYDCIGFVNFVLSKVLKSSMASGIWATSMKYFMATGPRFHVTEFDDSAKDDVLTLAEPGDIVLKSETEKHCGICREVGGKMVVTNCRSMATGLINSKLTGEWKFLARLKAV